jgi:hypothetical protein
MVTFVSGAATPGSTAAESVKESSSSYINIHSKLTLTPFALFN